MVTCELSRVQCCLRRCQHSMQHMQITREKGKLVKSRKWPEAPFAKRSVVTECRMALMREQEGNIIRQPPPPPGVLLPVLWGVSRHSAGTSCTACKCQGEIGGFCYYWQCSCRY